MKRGSGGSVTSDRCEDSSLTGDDDWEQETTELCWDDDNWDEEGTELCWEDDTWDEEGTELSREATPDEEADWEVALLEDGWDGTVVLEIGIGPLPMEDDSWSEKEIKPQAEYKSAK